MAIGSAQLVVAKYARGPDAIQKKIVMTMWMLIEFWFVINVRGDTILGV